MRRLRDLLFRLRAVLFPRAMERELDDEMAFHLEMETRKLIDRGMDPAAAAREAHRAFGEVGRQKERARDAWRIGPITDLAADVRHALRQLRRRPGFTAVAILTLALGSGATVALYSVVRGLLVRPLPVRDEAGLHVFWMDYDWRGVEFDFLKERGGLFDPIAVFSAEGVPLRTDAGTTLVLETVSSAELFDVLGSPPLMGRTFAPGEDRPGAEPVVVVSHSLWQQELGGDPEILGRRILLGGVLSTVIGVMSPDFYFPTPEFRVWRPLILDPADGNYQNNGWLTVIGRVPPDVPPAAVEREVQGIAQALGERFTYPDAWDKTKGAFTKPLRTYLLGEVRRPLFLLFGAVGLLLVMACVNAAALVLGRTTDRIDEMAVRSALGAGRGRLARQIVTESITLSILAGGAGALLAVLLFERLVAGLPLPAGFGETLRLDGVVFAAAFAMALGIGCAVSALPIRHVLRGRLDGGLARERSEAGLRRRTGRTHSALIVAEVALAVLLAVGATLLIRSVERLQALDPGFDPRGVLAVDLVTTAEAMDAPTRWQAFRDVLDQVSRLPGVVSAGYTNRLPVRDGGWQGTITVESRPDLADARRPNSLFRWATPSYFRTMGMEIRHGRGIEPDDRADAVPIAVVSEAFARRMWGEGEPIGQRIMSGFQGTGEWRTVVGVVKETRQVAMTGENPMALYIPYEQSAWPGEGQVLVVRTDRAPATIVPAIRRVVAGVDPRIAVSRPSPMTDIVDVSLAEPLRLRFFLSLFAGLALILGSVGVYGVVSYAVTRRRAEFGIRMALGAAPGRVLGEVMRRAMLPVVAGVGAGLVAAAALAQVVSGFLYDVAPIDPVSLTLAGTALLAAGVVAAAGPAWRAGRVSPVEALRAE